MKKLAFAILIVAAIILLASHSSIASLFGINYIKLVLSIAQVLGSAMCVVGLFVFLYSLFKSGNRKTLFQGAFWFLLGSIIVPFMNTVGFIAVLALIIWLDHTGQSIMPREIRTDS